MKAPLKTVDLVEINDGRKQAYIRYQSDSLILKLGNFVWPAQTTSALLLVALLFAFAEIKPLFIWTGVMLFLALAQALICFLGTRAANRNRRLEGWSRAFDISVILIAISWTCFSLILVPVADSEIRNFVGFIMGGAIIIYTGTQNLHYGILAFSITIIVISRSIRLITDTEGVLGIYGALMLIVFLVVMLGLAWLLRRFMLDGFSLQWEKTSLVAELEEQAKELEQARAEADESNLAKSRFLAQASHDLRQPLHAMGLHLASLSGEKLSPKTQAVKDRIEQSVEVLSKLFTSLLDVTLLDTRQLVPKPVGFDVSALCHEIADEFSIAAKAENMQIAAETENNLIIKSDPLLVRRILQNLVSNAIRHSEGGEVIVKAIRQDSHIRLRVQDTGKGISEIARARMFDEFVKGDTSHSGLGLGLTIVRRLSQVLNLKIDVTSSETSGTEFTIGPFHTTDAIDISEEVPPQLPASDTGRVLVIDDDRATLEATAAVLSNWGWDIDARSELNKKEIMSMDPPNLIISDYELAAGRTGLDIVSEIKAKHGAIPTLIITGSSLPKTRQRISEAGFLLLHKPVMPIQLRSAIISILG